MDIVTQPYIFGIKNNFVVILLVKRSVFYEKIHIGCANFGVGAYP